MSRKECRGYVVNLYRLIHKGGEAYLPAEVVSEIGVEAEMIRRDMDKLEGCKEGSGSSPLLCHRKSIYVE